MGAALRLTILAVPPLVALIREELGLSATAVSLLVSLPVGLFALAAIPGSALIARLGTLPILTGSLLVIAAGAALRGASPNLLLLYAATTVMGVGVAVMQPAMPAIVREWMPGRIGFGTAVYSNGLLVSEVLPPLLTASWLLPLAGGWRPALAAWSAPAALTAVLLWLLAPRTGGSRGEHHSLHRHWRPNWKSRLTWQLGLVPATGSSLYFAANALLPVYLGSRGHDELIAPALTALNFAQLPASFLLLAFAARIERRAWPLLLAGALAAAGVAGLLSPIGAATVFWAGVLGFSCAATMILGLALPPLLVPPEDVTGASGAMFTISYASAVLVALLCGAGWDLSGGRPVAAFAPLLLWALLLPATALSLVRDRRLR